MYTNIVTEVDLGVGIITLNRPERHNAFDDALIGELSDAIDRMAGDPAVRVLVISSTGKSFCAGADLQWLKRAAGYSDQENLQDARRLAELMATLKRLVQLLHDAVVHRAAVKRMRMQDHRERRRRPLAMDIPTFQPPVRAVEDHLGHLILQRTFLALHPVPRPPPPSGS